MSCHTLSTVDSEPRFPPYTPPLQGAILLASNPGIANVIAGLASVASYQNGVTRHMLWERRNQSVAGYTNMSVADMVAAITSYQDTLDGPNVRGKGDWGARGICE
jgi:hypothetical protein